MIIGDSLTISGQTYQIDDSKRDHIESIWQRCLDECKNLEAEHEEMLGESGTTGNFLDDTNVCRDTYEDCRKEILKLVTEG